MSIVRFALLQKKLILCLKKTFTGRKGSSLTGSSSQRPHPSYQMVHLTIMYDIGVGRWFKKQQFVLKYVMY